MVAFCAIYVVQSIKQIPSSHLCDWSVFRLAALQELVHELETQGVARHRLDTPETMNVNEAMAKQIASGIRLILSKKTASTPAILPVNLDTASIVSDNIGAAGTSDRIHYEMDPWFSLHAGAQLPDPPQLSPDTAQVPLGGTAVPATTSPFFELDLFGLGKNPMPFIPEWNVSMWGGIGGVASENGASGSGMEFQWDMQEKHGAETGEVPAYDQDGLAMFGLN